MATRLAQVGITILGLAVMGTAWLLWLGTPTALLLGADDAGRLSSRLPAGKVAVVVRESGPTSVGAVAQVGDRVDVMAYFPSQVQRGESSTRVLLQDIAVYGVDTAAGPGGLMVGVSPDDVRLLQDSVQQGARFSISLRAARGQSPGARVQKESLADSELASWLRGQ